MPCWSKVRRTSIVAVGAFLGFFFAVPLRVAARSGEKAEARREVTWSAAQVALILSGKRVGSSTMKTSDSSRTPRRRADFWSSFLRVSPRPSASPVGREMVVSLYFLVGLHICC